MTANRCQVYVPARQEWKAWSATFVPMDARWAWMAVTKVMSLRVERWSFIKTIRLLVRTLQRCVFFSRKHTLTLTLTTTLRILRIFPLNWMICIIPAFLCQWICWTMSFRTTNIENKVARPNLFSLECSCSLVRSVDSSSSNVSSLSAFHIMAQKACGLRDVSQCMS